MPFKGRFSRFIVRWDMDFWKQFTKECLIKEFQDRQITFASQPTLQLSYKDQLLGQVYIPDFVCYEKVIVELKSVRTAAPEHTAQVINYLKATGMKLGLLVNFGAYPKATVKRLVL